MVVYIDSIFIQDLFCNYIVLYQTEFLTRKKAKLKNRILATFVASSYSCIMIAFSIKWLNILWLKLLLGITVVYILYKPEKLKEYVKEIIIFLIISVLNVGTCILIYQMGFNGNVKNIISKIIVYFISFIITYFLNKYTWKLYKYSLNENNLIYDVTLNLNGNKFLYKGFLDTGNTAYSVSQNVPIIFATYISNKQKKLVNNILCNSSSFFDFNVSGINGKSKVTAINTICEMCGKKFKAGVVFTDDGVSCQNKYNLILNIFVFENIIGGIHI